MTYFSDIPENTLTLDVAKIPLIYVPKIGQVIVRHEFGKVIAFIDNKRLELNTLTAHRIGYNMAIAKLEPDEMIVLTINGERLELLWPVASKISTALLRKADAADDWQLRRVK